MYRARTSSTSRRAMGVRAAGAAAALLLLAGCSVSVPDPESSPEETVAGTLTPSVDPGPGPSTEPSVTPEVEELTFPDETTTGVPEGVELRDSDTVVVTRDGAVVDRLDIDGVVVVEADDVTIRRSLIRGEGTYAIEMRPGASNLLVEDVEIDGAQIESAAVCCGSYTLRRVNIHDVNEGPRAGGNVTIEDSYIHSMRRCRDRTYDEGCHIDAVQSTDGSDVLIRGNNLQAYNPETGDYMNAVYMFGTELGDLTDVVFADNLVNGGNYTINGGGGGTRDAEVTITGNRFGRDFRYAPAGNFGPDVVFDDTNVYHDTGTPVTGEVIDWARD